MKKTIFALFALLAVFACNRNEVDFQNPDWEKDNTPMSFSLSVNAIGGDAETKAALKAGWSDGDVVYIFFDAIPTKYVKKTFNGSAWSDTYPGGDFVAGDFSASGPAASRNMTAVWFPQGEVDVTYADSKFSFTIGGEKIYSHYMSVYAAYSISGTTVSGTLDMEKPAGFVQFFVPGIAAGDAPAYRLMESHLTPKACDYVALAGGVNESALADGYSLKGMAFTTDESVTGALFGGYLSSAGTTTSYKFSLVKGVSAALPAAEGTYTLLGYRNIAAGTSMTFPTIEGGAWGEMSPFVDLGFGDIQWATGNLKDDGTIVSPLATGDYYQWGATAVYANTAQYYTGNTELPSNRDIAYLRSSGNWHMPSKAQFDALVNSANTTGTWVVTGGPTNGGWLFTSKENGISLFFVIAGEYASGTLNNLGVWGRCWSSTPLENDSYRAYYLILSNSAWMAGTNRDPRDWGIPVRPITGAPTPAPAAWDGNLSSLNGTEPSGYATATDGMTITGTLSANVKVSIDPGATVTLNNATIDGISINNDNSNSYKWAGITCNGDATIILNGNNSVAAFYGSSGIYIPSGSTLTIQGPGSLTANGRGTGCAGIGGKYTGAYGNIRIEGGTITASGGAAGAGIGSGAGGNGGDIIITGGQITATGGEGGCGIGSGQQGSCGDITISGGTITATGGTNASGIGSSNNGACGNILINGGTITATAMGSYGPGIGCGPHYSSCSSITITSDVTRVTATKASGTPNSIGAGYNSSGCGPVTIGGLVLWDGSAYQNGGGDYLPASPLVYIPHAAFSVSGNQKVYFSPGNLQCIPNSTGAVEEPYTRAWRFAENQWGYIGVGEASEPGNAHRMWEGGSYTNWYDIFGWGTWTGSSPNPAKADQYNTSYAWGDGDFTEESLLANAPLPGKNWRTLSQTEWAYLFNTRETTSGVRYAKATVNSVEGVILLPDDWSTSYHSLASTNTAEAAYTANEISAAAWMIDFEAHGAIFLPVATIHYYGSGPELHHTGNYWSSTPYSDTKAYCVNFSSSTLSASYTHDRSTAISVRLVYND
jgi:hypothetical protein